LSFNRGFSLKNNFPDQWFDLGEVQPPPPATFEVTLKIQREMFPLGIENLKVNADGLRVFFVREKDYTDEIHGVEVTLTSSPSPVTPGLDSDNGLVVPQNLNSAIVGSSPVMELRLSFVNNATNRKLFTEGKLTDIILLVGCKAELTPYPL